MAEDEPSRVLDVAAPAARGARAKPHPAAPVAAVVRRASPAPHGPRRGRVRPLHPHVRARRGEPDAGLGLPPPPAREGGPAPLAAVLARGAAPGDDRGQLLTPGR